MAVAVKPFGGVVADEAGFDFVPLHFVLLQQIEQIRGFDFAPVSVQYTVFVVIVICQFFKAFFHAAPFDDASGRISRIARPIAVEVFRHFGNHFARCQYIQIGEHGIFPDLEIFVADIASADDGGAVVGGQRFVVHTAVEAREVGQIAQRAPSARDEGVEQAYFDIRMAVERQ